MWFHCVFALFNRKQKRTFDYFTGENQSGSHIRHSTILYYTHHTIGFCIEYKLEINKCKCIAQTRRREAQNVPKENENIDQIRNLEKKNINKLTTTEKKRRQRRKKRKNQHTISNGMKTFDRLVCRSRNVRGHTLAPIHTIIPFQLLIYSLDIVLT